jgi:hypothetical protein
MQSFHEVIEGLVLPPIPVEVPTQLREAVIFLARLALQLL